MNGFSRIYSKMWKKKKSWRWSRKYNVVARKNKISSFFKKRQAALEWDVWKNIALSFLVLQIVFWAAEEKKRRNEVEKKERKKKKLSIAQNLSIHSALDQSLLSPCLSTYTYLLDAYRSFFFRLVYYFFTLFFRNVEKQSIFLGHCLTLF